MDRDRLGDWPAALLRGFLVSVPAVPLGGLLLSLVAKVFTDSGGGNGGLGKGVLAIALFLSRTSTMWSRA